MHKRTSPFMLVVVDARLVGGSAVAEGMRSADGPGDVYGHSSPIVCEVKLELSSPLPQAQ